MTLFILLAALMASQMYILASSEVIITEIKYILKITLGTCNQHVPMILSNNYWCQTKPRSLLDTGIDAISLSVQQIMKNVPFTDLDFLLKCIEFPSCQNYFKKLTMAPNLGMAIFYTKYYYTKGFPSIMRKHVPRPGAL